MLIVPLAPERAQILVSNSRFVASLAPVDSQADARAFVARIRGEFPDATHNVPAYVVGDANSRTEYCSDDGEPSGTSGRPLLAVLKGSGMTDLAVVVTRYFGGTLLGTGGLVKAYGDAGRAVLERAHRAALVEARRAETLLPYQLFDKVRLLAGECGAVIVSGEFLEEVRLVLDIPLGSWPRFESGLASLSAGRSVLRALETTTIRKPL
jgi:uncharacterized YigZ family protein